MKSSNTQPLKGFRDFLPEEARKRQWLKMRLSQICEQWGYEPLETPTLEPLEIFEGEIGEGEKLFYKFKDLGGRDVILRYDQTVPTCRVVAQYYNQLPMPFKRYQIQSNFRAENPQKGRYREFVQCDADIFGIKSPIADAETIALSLDIYKRLGFKKVKVLFNNRDLIRDVPYEAVTAIDKIKKIGVEDVLREMQDKGISLEKAKEYVKFVQNLQPDETVKIILDYLAKSGFDKDWYEFDPTIVRSFSYSNGPIWEVEIPGYEGGSVLGGERYDRIIKNLIGQEIPGTGFGLGFDRTLEACEQFGLTPQSKTVTKVLVTVFSPELMDKSLAVTILLQSNKVNSETYPDPKVSLDKQLKYANKKGIPYVVIIGPDEISSGLVNLKDMRSGSQEKITTESLIKKLSSV